MVSTHETPGVSGSRVGLPDPDSGVGGYQDVTGVETVLRSAEVGPVLVDMTLCDFVDRFV